MTDKGKVGKIVPEGDETIAGGEPNTRKRRALKKAPDAPRRFKSAYICYVMDKMDDVKANLPQDNKATDTMKVLANMWRDLSSRERRKYEDIAAADKSRYFEEMATYSGPLQVPNKRQKKPPGAPKRAMSAFLSYSQMMRPHIRAEFRDLKNTDISGVLAQRWKDASEEERRPHIEKELKDREKYHEDMTKWKSEEQERLQELQTKQQLQQQILQQQQQQQQQAMASRAGGYFDRQMTPPSLWNPMAGLPGYGDEGLYAAEYTNPTFSHGSGSSASSSSSRNSTKQRHKHAMVEDYPPGLPGMNMGYGMGRGMMGSGMGPGMGPGPPVVGAAGVGVGGGAGAGARYDPYAGTAGYGMGAYMPTGSYPPTGPMYTEGNMRGPLPGPLPVPVPGRMPGAADMHGVYDFDPSRRRNMPHMYYPSYPPPPQYFPPMDTRLSKLDNKRRDKDEAPYKFGNDCYYNMSMSQQQNPIPQRATVSSFDPSVALKSERSKDGRRTKAPPVKKRTHSNAPEIAPGSSSGEASRSAGGDNKRLTQQSSSRKKKSQLGKNATSTTSSPSSPSAGSAASGSLSGGGLSGISEMFCDFGEMKPNDAIAVADVSPFSAHGVAKSGGSGTSDSPPSCEESLALFGSKLNDALGSAGSSPTKLRVMKGKKDLSVAPLDGSPLSASSAFGDISDVASNSSASESVSKSVGSQGGCSATGSASSSIQLLREALMQQPR